MARKNVPGYLHHKKSGQAMVVLQGKTIYLGKYKSKSSREEYERVIGDYLANGKKLPPTRSQTEITIEEAVLLFLEYAKKHYTKNGKVTSTFTNYRESLCILTKHYASCGVSDFGPVSLIFLRDKMLHEGFIDKKEERQVYARKTINDRVASIVAMFRWLVVRQP